MAGKPMVFNQHALLAFDPLVFSSILPPKLHEPYFGCEKGCM